MWTEGIGRGTGCQLGWLVSGVNVMYAKLSCRQCMYLMYVGIDWLMGPPRGSQGVSDGEATVMVEARATGG